MTYEQKIAYARSILNNVTFQAVLAIQRQERRHEDKTPEKERRQ